ncbi:hypothetical protein U2F25_17035 [Micromonospora sp. 4G53]|uniref:Uncharacterized protein n=1 Tax=Micromonospora sicca TaxID=2202420 RepID=A0ABU5JEX9_9ACTN|nr:hypothetical protein [Micromonospora sp. 4G53]MDZ5491146.1 hypothetical protein [Micromonospora sp. 4G53]
MPNPVNEPIDSTMRIVAITAVEVAVSSRLSTRSRLWAISCALGTPTAQKKTIPTTSIAG